MANKEFAERDEYQNEKTDSTGWPKEVPIQVMVPEAIRRQVAMMGVNRGENIRTVVLRGLRAIGIDVPDSELADRRGRRRGNGRDGHGEE